MRKDLQFANERQSYLQYNLHNILPDHLSIAAYAGDTQMSLVRQIIPSSQIHMNIHLPCYCTSHLPVGLHFCHRAPFLSGSEYVQICYRLYIYITVNPVINGSGILINRLVPSLWCVYPNVICRGLCLCSVSSYGRWLFVFIDIGGIVDHHTFLQ